MAENTSTRSASSIILATALDTTWRMFVPILGGVFVGIALDHAFSVAPIATVTCLIIGVATSGFLITRQLIKVRKNSR